MPNPGPWQYSRWMYVISRSMLMNKPIGGEIAALDVCIQAFWNTATQTGTRPWLQQEFEERSAEPAAPGNPGDPTIEPVYNNIKFLTCIARDIKKIPMKNNADIYTVVAGVATVTGPGAGTEQDYCDTLIAATGNRYLGFEGNTI